MEESVYLSTVVATGLPRLGPRLGLSLISRIGALLI